MTRCRTADPKETVLLPGYFNGVRAALTEGEIVHVEAGIKDFDLDAPTMLSVWAACAGADRFRLAVTTIPDDGDVTTAPAPDFTERN